MSECNQLTIKALQRVYSRQQPPPVAAGGGQTPQQQAGERRRRPFEPQLVSPPVATRNGLARLLLGSAILAHIFCHRAGISSLAWFWGELSQRVNDPHACRFEMSLVVRREGVAVKQGGGRNQGILARHRSRQSVSIRKLIWRAADADPAGGWAAGNWRIA